MADTNGATASVANGASNTILKILSGVQSGVEVSLANGQYSLGSGNEDDIQIIDVSLKAGHLKLRISQGKIEIAGASGSLKSNNGVVLDNDTDFHEIEPLDVITAGTTRFALGPPTALWSSITNIDGGEPAAPPARKRSRLAAIAETGWLQRARKLAIPIAAVVILVVFATWQLSSTRMNIGFNRGSGPSELEQTTAAVGQFPFARNVDVKQEVDGTIYATGYVESPVERRAVAGAIEKTGIPVRVRILVLQSLRNEVENLAKSENMNVTSTLSPKGELTLEGVVLSEDAANKFVDLVRDRILGLARVESRLKTSKSLLAEVEKLAQVSQIHQWVLLRDAHDVIEASGAIPIEKIDAWAGFLQSYAKRFAKDIGLRSYVQLQTVQMTAAATPGSRDQAVVIGGQKTDSNDITLDVERLKVGAYAPKDVLVGAPQLADQAQPNSPVTAARLLETDNIGPLLVKDDARMERPAVTMASATTETTTATIPTRDVKPVSAQNVSEGAAKPPEAGGGSTGAGSSASQANSGSPLRSGGDLTSRARQLLEDWRENGLRHNSRDEAFRLALERLQKGGQPGAAADSERDRQQFVEQYLPLLNVRRTVDAGGPPCWEDAHLTQANLPAAVFWLDLLSVSDKLSLSTLDQDTQALLLEAALNPKRVTQCAQKIPGGAATSAKSLYLTEITRNPEFVRFITRDLQPFALDITGASIGQQERFIQIRSGRKLQEGAAPSRASRLAAVGELGVAIQVKNGLSTVVFGQEMTWLAE